MVWAQDNCTFFYMTAWAPKESVPANKVKRTSPLQPSLKKTQQHLFYILLVTNK